MIGVELKYFMKKQYWTQLTACKLNNFVRKQYFKPFNYADNYNEFI